MFVNTHNSTLKKTKQKLKKTDFCFGSKNNVKKHLRTRYFNDQRDMYNVVDLSQILQLYVQESKLENLLILSKHNYRLAGSGP